MTTAEPPSLATDRTPTRYCETAEEGRLRARSKLATTSFAVSGSPLQNVTPGRSLKRQWVGPSCSQLAARAGWGFSSGESETRGS